jgi:hypothetical protein
MPEYDIADPNDPNTLVVPFIFVPHGHPLPIEWMHEHPGWVRFPATFVPRDPAPGESSPQWNARIDFSDAPAAGGGDIPPVRTIDDYDTTAAALRAWREAQATMADPVGAAGMRRVADAPPQVQSRTYASTANELLGIPSAKAQGAEEEETTRRGPGGREFSPAEELRLDRYAVATRTLRELEPNNPQLESVSDPSHVPDEAWVESLEKEARAAVARRNARSAVPERSSLSDDRRNYILNGDGKGGGGHGPGRKTPGKSEFPRDWSDDKTVKAIEDVASDPTSARGPAYNGRTYVEGIRDGVGVRVIVGRDGKTIVTAFPTNTPRNAE